LGTQDRKVISVIRGHKEQPDTQDPKEHKVSQGIQEVKEIQGIRVAKD